MKDCKGIWGWMFGHSYRSKYGTKSFLPSGLTLPQPVLIAENIVNFKTKERIHTITYCTRCGDTIYPKQ